MVRKRVEAISIEDSSSEALRKLAAGLQGMSDGELAEPISGVGHAFIIMLGPHSDHGMCWCQVEMIPCAVHPQHDILRHRETLN